MAPSDGRASDSEGRRPHSVDQVRGLAEAYGRGARAYAAVLDPRFDGSNLPNVGGSGYEVRE